MSRRRFRPALDALEGRLPLDGDMSPGPDPFDDPFSYPPEDMSPGPDTSLDVDYGSDPGDMSPGPGDNPFGPPTDPIEPDPPPFDGDNPPAEYLPPAPIGPAGPAY